MRFETTLNYSRRRGRSRAPARQFRPGSGERRALAARGDVAELGAFIRDDMAENMVQPAEMAAEFLQVLRSRRSEWPSRGVTGNIGPHASGRSVQRFFVAQGRTAQGRFTPWVLINDARNKAGFPYANDVDQGLRTDGERVSDTRYAANHRAVERTWNQNLAGMLANALAHRRQQQQP